MPGRPVPKNLGSSGRPGGPRDYTPAAEDEDDFRPPNPKGTLATAKPGVVIGWLLVIVGVIAVIAVPFLPVNWPSALQPWIVPGLIAMIIIGMVTLFMQMPSKRPNAGDGAQV